MVNDSDTGGQIAGIIKPLFRHQNERASRRRVKFVVGILARISKRETETRGELLKSLHPFQDVRFSSVRFLTEQEIDAMYHLSFSDLWEIAKEAGYDQPLQMDRDIKRFIERGLCSKTGDSARELKAKSLWSERAPPKRALSDERKSKAKGGRMPDLLRGRPRRDNYNFSQFINQMGLAAAKSKAEANWQSFSQWIRTANCYPIRFDGSVQGRIYLSEKELPRTPKGRRDITIGVSPDKFRIGRATNQIGAFLKETNFHNTDVLFVEILPRVNKKIAAPGEAGKASPSSNQ